MFLGSQLFGCLREFRIDPEAFFDHMQRCGYTHIEPVILLDNEGPLAQRFRGVAWSMEETPGFLRAMAKRNLSVYSAHTFTADISTKLPEMKELASYGVKAFVFRLPNDLSGDLTPHAHMLQGLAEELQKCGCQSWLHNGQGAFAGPKGETPFERVLAAAPLLGAQIDTGWALMDGCDLLPLLEDPAIRLASLHFKDMAVDFMNKTGNDIFATMGEGVTDIAATLQSAGDVPVFMDEDFSVSGDFLKDLAVSSSAIYAATAKLADGPRCRKSTLEIFDIATGERTALKEFDNVIEAPNWTKDGKYLLYNSDGAIWKYDIEKDTTEKLDTGTANHCNNDHVLSPDGKWLAVSHMTHGEGTFTSRVYIVPAEGGEARLVTPNSPSFLHGWSPDGKELAYCAFRDPEAGGDVYVIPAEGGEEHRLTGSIGLNDGPEYDPDGQYLWYNSVRSGEMQIWRMRRDGTEQRQMTFDADLHSWFPHVSPDGKTVVMISYRAEDVAAGEHVPDKCVFLRLMSAEGGVPHTILTLFGGQGTINVNSWAPDSRRFAFVSYRP